MRRVTDAGQSVISSVEPVAPLPVRVERVATLRPAGETSALESAEFRALDLLVSGIALIALSPLLVAIAVAIRIETRGPSLTRERRLGLDLEVFTLHNFRTTAVGPMAEPRPTRVGRVLIGSRIACLPALWDVARGRMSLVGPRPARPVEAALQQPEWYARFAVKPGLTGLAQLQGSCDEERIRLDFDYVCRRSLRLNMQILARGALGIVGFRRRNR
jgi:lipopolysaccharide/colanic/teichoic acid biosynthesis glycosyltransferase